MRKKLIIGNWKMNLNMQEASLYLHKLMEVLKPRRDVEVVVAPTTLTLQSLSLQINRRIVKLAAQNCYWRDHGAYTGEVPAAHLRRIARRHAGSRPRSAFEPVRHRRQIGRASCRERV